MADKRATRRAMVTIALDNRELDRGLAGARRAVRKAGDDMNRTGRRIGGRASGAAGKKGGAFGFGAVAGAGAGVAGKVGDFITDTATDLLDFERALARFQIAAGKTPAEMIAMRAAILDVSKATGVAHSQILAGTQTYVDLTGDVAGAEQVMRSFARIAQASGSSVADVASATAAMQQSLNLDSRNIERVFSGFIQQGKRGAVALKDFAAELASLAPRWAKFREGATDVGVAQLGAAFQVARQGFGSAAEAATGLEALMGALVQHADRFESGGVTIFDQGKGGKTLRSFEQILESIAKSRLVRDPTLMNKALGSKEAEQTLSILLRARQTITSTGNAYQDLVDTGKDAGAVQRDLDTYLQSSAGRMDAAFNSMRLAIVDAFTPERIKSFAEALEKTASVLKDVIDLTETVGDAITVDEDTAAQAAARALTQQNDGTPRDREETKSLIRRVLDGEDLELGTAANNFLDSEDWKQGAEIAIKNLGLSPTGNDWLPADQDPWAPRSRPLGPADHAAMQAFLDKLGGVIRESIGDGMSRAKVELKTDSNTTARTVANAPANRQPRRR